MSSMAFVATTGSAATAVAVSLAGGVGRGAGSTYLAAVSTCFLEFKCDCIELAELNVLLFDPPPS